MAEKVKTRIEWLDSLKGFSIFLVIFGHAVCVLPGAQEAGGYYELMRWIYGFHMPLFTVISGYLLSECRSRKELWLSTKKSFVRYIIPYFIFGIISLLIYIIVEALHGTLGMKNLVLRCAGLVYSVGNWLWIPYCSTIYYLTALFCGLFIMRAIMLTDNRKFRTALVLLSVILGHLTDILNIPKLFWNFDTGLIMVGFLYLGYLMKSREWKAPEHPFIISMLLIAAGTVFIMSNKYFGVKEMSFDSASFGSPLHMWAGGVCMVWAIFLLFKSFEPGLKGRLKSLLSFWGRNTMIMMVCDQIIRDSLMHVFEALGLPGLWFLRFIIALILQLPFIFLWNRFWRKAEPRLMKLIIK